MVSMAYDEKLAERIRRLMAGRRGVIERKMMGGLTFMTESGMFCSASGKGGLLVRVDPQSRDKFLGEAHVERHRWTPDDGLYPRDRRGLSHRSRSEEVG
jgi:TfoX/Sxy family transcriptional regulator of competence genes